MAAPTTTTPSAPGPTGVGSGGYASAQETTQGFAELRRQKASKKIEREKESAAKKKPTVSRGAAPATEEALTPTEARESIERQKRLDEASLMVTTAERELAAGRPQNALEISRRAESAAGSSLGLVPASTQTRAHVALKQFQDAARTATRLLQGDASDVVIVDGLIAGADAAEAIGDRRLARSLLQKALLPANKDKARRAVAEQKLAVINARDIRDRDAYEAPAAAAPPAKSSASDSSSGY